MNLPEQKSKIIVLCGPTAIGKTTTAIELCRALKGEIVNADSMQIYRHMNIGTAKPTPEEQDLVPHHLVDIVNPDEDFDAAKFAAKAHDVIQFLGRRHILPIVAGGTGLYIKALIHGLFEMMPKDPEIRKELNAKAVKYGPGHLYDQLKEIDPETSLRLHPNDLHRIIRAIEVFQISGQPISRYQKQHGFNDKPYKALKIGLVMDRETLYRRIDLRVDAMLEEGLVDEVKGLLEKGYSSGLKSMQAIGYRHMIRFLEGQADWPETVRTLKRDTRRYAKRQRTWFKKDKAIIWKQPKDIEEMIQLAKDFLNGTDSVPPVSGKFI